MTESQRPKLMISYSRADLEFVLKLFGDLKDAGIHAWLDQIDIPAGANWDREIEAALEAASTLLVVISKNSRKSENVKNEISHALELGKHVVPIILDKSPAPLMITRLQREDFTGSYANALERLIIRLRRSGRTESFEAITEEAVHRAVRHSADRISGADIEAFDAARASSPEVEQETRAHRSISLEPMTRHHESPSRNVSAPHTSRAKMVTYGLGGGTLAVAAGLALWLSGSYGKSNDERAGLETGSKTDIVVPKPAAPALPTVEKAKPAILQQEVKPEVEDTKGSVPIQPQPSSEEALSTSDKLPAELIGSWDQICNPAAPKGERVRSMLTLTATNATMQVYEHPGECGNKEPAAIIIETLGIKQVKTLADGVYHLDLIATGVGLTPSKLAFDWSSKKELGKNDWKFENTSVLGKLSKEYFGYELAPGDPIYTTWRLVDGQLQYLPAREAGQNANTRPTLAKLSTRYLATRRPKP